MKTSSKTTNVSILTALLQLNGYTYSYKNEEYPEYKLPDTPQIGLMAQEVEQVFPQLVVTNKAGHKAVNYLGLVPVLVEAIKQQQNLLEAQQMYLKRLEEKMNKLEEKLWDNEFVELS